MKKNTLIIGYFILASSLSQAAFRIDLGTAAKSATMSGTATVTVNIDGTGNVTLSGALTNDSGGTIFKPTVTGTSSSGFGQSFILTIDLAKSFDPITGAITTAGPGSLNTAGAGVLSDPNGNTTGTSSLGTEGLVLSLNTAGIGSGLSVALQKFGVNAPDPGSTIGVFPKQGGSLQTYNTEGAGAKKFDLTSAISLAGGGTGNTAIAAFYEIDDATDANKGFRNSSFTFDVVAP